MACRRLAAVLLFLHGWSMLFAQAGSPKRSIPAPVNTPQEVLLLFAGQNPGDKIFLTLNNNRGAALTTTMTLYLTDGTAVPLPDVSMVAFESKLIDLGAVLSASGIDAGALGYLKLDYSGINMEMGAQLTLYPASGGAGVDSTRSLKTDFKSLQRDAAFWIPAGGEAHVGFTDNSANSISVSLNCGISGSQFNIQPGQTVVKVFRSADLGVPSLNGDFAASCDAESDGAFDALRAAGVVRGPDGYGAPIRFYDPFTSTFSSLTAVGVQTEALTRVVVHNLTAAPVSVTPTLREATVQSPRQVSLPEVVLAPYATLSLFTQPLFISLSAAGVRRATFSLESNAPLGAIVGSLTQISNTDGLIEDVPLRTANPPVYSRGAYPLRWDQDYTNLVTVTNTGSSTRSLRAYITAGGIMYLLERVDLQPGTSVVFDVDSLRSRQVPDEADNKIPLNATYGKFLWFDLTMGKVQGLMGLQSLSSVANNRRSSFSCGASCEYDYIDEPVFISNNPPSIGGDLITTLAYGAEQDQYLTQEYNFGSYSEYYQLAYSDWESQFSMSTEGIVGFGPSTISGNAIVFYGLSPGVASFNLTDYYEQFVLSDDGTYCEENDSTGPGGGYISVTPTVSVSGPFQVPLAAPGTSNAVNTVTLTATGTPSGGQYTWSISSGNSVTLSTTSGSTVTLTSTQAGDSQVQVTYTLNGETATQDQSETVQQPTSLTAVSDTGTTQDYNCTPLSYNGDQRSVQYGVNDQSGNGMTQSGMPVTETFSQLNNTCGTSPSPVNGTTTVGDFGDHFYLCSSACLPASSSGQPQGSCQAQFTHTWSVNGFQVFNHTLTYTCTTITPQ